MINDPDDYQLGQLYRYSVLASVPGYQYRQNRDNSSYVLICSAYPAEEIVAKLASYCTVEAESNEHQRVMIIALLSALSFKKVDDIDLCPIISHYLITMNGYGRWMESILKSVISQAALNLC